MKQEYHKDIKKATYEVIKTAIEAGFDENSNFIRFYLRCAKDLRDSSNPEFYVEKISPKIFPDDDTWLAKRNDISLKYKGRLREDLIKLYELYYNLAVIVRRDNIITRMGDNDVDKLIDKLLG